MSVIAAYKAREIAEDFEPESSEEFKNISKAIENRAKRGFLHLIWEYPLSPKMITHLEEEGYKVSEVIGCNYRIDWHNEY